MDKIIATVEDIVYRNDDNGYTVADIAVGNELHTCVGILPGLRTGEKVELTGQWKHHSSYGQQFAVEVCRPLPPDSSEGLLRYLSSGAVPGVGEVMAQRIVDAFGMDTLDIIHYEPERLREISGIGEARAELIARSLVHATVEELKV